MPFLIQQNEKKIKVLIAVITFLICLLVALLNQKIIPHTGAIPTFIYKLPALNAIINATCSVILILSLFAIKQKKIALHKKLNTMALGLSLLFFISYVTAHYFIPDTKYGDFNHDGLISLDEKAAVSAIKPIYLLILLSHIFLAIIVLPLVMLSFYYGLTNQVNKHRKLTRYSYPVWLYVTISGVIVYFMISPYYNY
ncbi:MAG: DUF420 domain-containing protein [Bacteroidetes bacterium]|nr:DUF420 domain-containing protein [Bacteroidota bacterium]